MKRLKKVICCLLMFAILFSTWGMTEVQAADDVSVSGATYPDWIKKGGAFVLKGTVKSNSTITELTASLNDGHNNVMYSKTVRPNSTQYNLSGIDAAMRFDLLSANPYTYQVKVRNSSGLHTVIMKPFTVYSGSKPSFATGLDTSAKYRLCVQEDSSMVADIAGRASGSNALVKKDNGQSTANWYLEYAGSSAYMIKNADTGLYLDVANGGYRNGTNVQIWTKTVQRLSAGISYRMEVPIRLFPKRITLP